MLGFDPAINDKNLNSEIETKMTLCKSIYLHSINDKNLNSEIETWMSTSRLPGVRSTINDKNLNSEIETKYKQ